MNQPGKFRHVVKPVAGECLSSWLSRNSTCPHIGWAHSDLLASCRSLARLTAGGDIDRLYERKELYVLLPIAIDTLSARFALPEDICGVNHSFKYCPQCLVEDVQRKRAPAWRIAWRERGICLCEKHDHLVLLQQMPISSEEQFHRAWLALSGHLGSGKFIFGNHFIHRLPLLCNSSAIEQQLCRLVLRVAKWVRGAASIPTYGRPSFECLRFLMGYLLYRPFAQCKGGLGRWFIGAQEVNGVLLSEFKFPGARELVSALDMATPKQLAISYLFVGVSYELFDERELELISKALYFTNSPFPNCRSELRSIARCFQPTNIEAFRRSAFKNLHAGDLPHLDWLLGDGA